jgi:hypothetical protein
MTWTQLDALMTRRRQLLDMLTAERNRLEHAVGPTRRSLVDHIRWLERRVAAVDRDLDDTIARSPVWRAKEDLLRSMPGVGPVVSRTLLADVPELGFGAGMLNDLVVTSRGDVYITDSFVPVLWQVTAEQVAAGGGEPRAIAVAPETEWVEGGFNLNGIVALQGGRTLIVGQSDAGKLLRIDLDTNDPGARRITEVALDEPVYSDGLLLDQGRLVAVTFLPDETLTFIRLDARGTSGAIEERRTDATFRGPSTVDRAGHYYLVVNADFATGATPFTVSAVQRKRVHR